MIDDIDKLARELPAMTLHGNIPTATTMALAVRVTELRAVFDAAVRLLEYEGACDAIEDPADTYHCGDKDCRHCELNRVTSAV